MRCLDARRLYERGFADPLTLEEELQVEAHVAQCSPCALALERERRFDALLRGLPEAPIERLDVEATRSAIRDRIDAVSHVAVSHVTGATGPTERNVAEEDDPPGSSTAPARRWLAAGMASAVLAAAALWAMTLGPSNLGPSNQGEGTRPEPIAGSHDSGPVGPGSRRSAVPPLATRDGLDVRPTTDSSPGGSGTTLEAAVDVAAAGASLERSDLDPDRLARARALVRGLLADREEARDATAPREAWEGEADRIDRAVEERLGPWPVMRLVEGFALDADAGVARRALRYLGVRGDWNSARVLERALASSDLAGAAVEGLRDLGPRGEDGLGRALWGTPCAARVLETVEERLGAGGAEADRAVAWIQRTIDGHGGEVATSPAGDLLDLLNAACGPRPGEPARRGGFGPAEHRGWLFELAAEPRWRPVALDALAQVEGVEWDLLARLEGHGPRTDEGVLLDLIERLGCRSALAWVEETCRRGTRRGRALQVLAGLGGREGVERLISLRREFERETFEVAFGRALALHSESFREYGVFLAGQGARAEAREFLDLLIRLGDARAIPILCVLCGGRALADDDRERVLLIAGELGAGSAGAGAYLEGLRTTFDGLDADERDLAAAYLWSARRMGALADETSAHTWLPESTDSERRRVVELLAQDDLGHGGALRRFHLARELDSILIHRGESDRFVRDSKRRSRRFLGGLTP